MTAENLHRAARPAVEGPCFNEAAADDRGKPARAYPPPLAERCFNEAAADDRGKRLGQGGVVPQPEVLQ